MSGDNGGGASAAALADGLAAVFAAELAEQAQAALDAWTRTATAPTRADGCRELARIFHTIKGGAGLAGRAPLAAAAAALEHFFADPSPGAAPPQATVDALFDAAGLPAPALAPLLVTLAGTCTDAAAVDELVACAVGTHRLALPFDGLAGAALLAGGAAEAGAAFAAGVRETLWLHDLLRVARPLRRATALLLRDGAALVVDRVHPPRALAIDPLPADTPAHAWLRGVATDGDGSAWQVLDVARLPFAAPAAAPAAASVLVVDDSLVAREAAAAALRAARVSFDLATDGHEALAKLRQGAYAVVLSDLEMPRLDGFGLLERMRASQHLAGQPVVVCSSRLDAETRGRLAPLGVAGYLPKPFAPGELLDSLRPWIDAAAA